LPEKENKKEESEEVKNKSVEESEENDSEAGKFNNLNYLENRNVGTPLKSSQESNLFQLILRFKN
jgi:hypothetical protein